MLNLINPLGPRRGNIRARRMTTGRYIRTLTMINTQAASYAHRVLLSTHTIATIYGG